MGDNEYGLQQPPARSSKDIPWWKRLYRWTGWRGKTLWDWQALLFVPVTIALIASLIALYQNFRQQEIEEQRAAAAQELETIRAERALGQAYLEYMGTLLLEKGLRRAGENSDVRLLARARTLAALDGVTGYRQARILRFLFETKLIQFGPKQEPPIISLKFAVLREIPLQKRSILSNADLERADLTKAKLSNAKLINTKLPQADLSGAHLSRADLSRADLSGADLSNAKGVSCQQTEQAESLEDATMPDGQKYEDWLKDKEGCGEDAKISGPS